MTNEQRIDPRPTRRYNGWTVHNTYAIRQGVRIRARCQEELITMIDLRDDTFTQRAGKGA